MVRIEPPGRLEIDRPEAARVSFAFSTARLTRRAVAGAAARSGDAALVGCAGEAALWWVAPSVAEPRRLPLGDRIPNAAQLSIVAIAGGFAVLTEHGLAVIDEEGRERWRIDRVTFDWRFVDEREGALWLADADDNLLGFDTSTGWERS